MRRALRCRGYSVLALVTSFAAASSPALSRAADLCFPPPGGVPGEGGAGPPVWWTPGAVPTGSQTTSFLDDPRWRGSFLNTHFDFARFQGLVQTDAGKKYLVLSWEVRADPAGANDRLYFGVWDESLGVNAGNVYRFDRTQATASPDGGAPGTSGLQGRIFHASGSTTGTTWIATASGSPPYPPPAWISEARVDVACTGTVCDHYAIRMRIPIEPTATVTDATPAGLKITGNTFRFWYEIQNFVSVSPPNDYVMLYTSPDGLSSATEDGPGIPPVRFPDPANWHQITMGSGSTCQGQISIDASQIYVNSPGNTLMNTTATVPSAPNNVFHARPKNNIPAAVRADIPAASVEARVRLANWGSVTYSSPTWQEVCASAVGSGANVPSGSQLDLSCTVPSPDACPYKPAGNSCGPQSGTKDDHQCILVDLKIPSGGTESFFFTPASAFRNMNFDAASKLSRQALIDIGGLGAAPGGGVNRDVLVYIQTRNMPAPGTNESKTPAWQRGDQASVARLARLELPKEGAIDRKTAERIRLALGSGQLTENQVQQIMPTYLAYVWHDTGKTIAKPGGGTAKVLGAQPTFGLYLAHDGNLEGWTHRLEAAGAEVLAPNFYKIPVPNDGSIAVMNHIEAVECVGPFCTIPLWLILLIILVLILMVWLVRRRSPSSP